MANRQSRRVAVMAALGLAVALGACAGRAKDADVQPVASSPPAGLPAQTLAAGECGLFLYTRRSPAQFVFFQRAPEENALAYIAGESVTLTRTSFGGLLFGEFVTEQAFNVSGQDLALSVTLTPGAEMEDGQRVESGLIKMTTEEGWEVMQPVAGARACMPG